MPSGLGAVMVVAAPALPTVVVALMVYGVGVRAAQEIESFRFVQFSRIEQNLQRGRRFPCRCKMQVRRQRREVVGIIDATGKLMNHWLLSRAVRTFFLSSAVSASFFGLSQCRGQGSAGKYGYPTRLSASFVPPVKFILGFQSALRISLVYGVSTNEMGNGCLLYIGLLFAFSTAHIIDQACFKPYIAEYEYVVDERERRIEPRHLSH